jgi:hypothetical protein
MDPLKDSLQSAAVSSYYHRRRPQFLRNLPAGTVTKAHVTNSETNSLERYLVVRGLSILRLL